MKLWNKIKKHAYATPNKEAFNTMILNALCYEKISYLELVRAVQQCFYSLPETTGMRVGVIISNRPLWAIYDLALTLKGATVVPIPYFFSDIQVRHIINDADLKLIIKEKLSEDESSKISRFDTISVIKTESSLEKPTCDGATIPLKEITPIPNPSPIAKITYTSGTTATPKGVMISQAAIDLVTESLAERTQASNHDRYLSLLPLSTLIENIGGLYVPLYVGATILYPENNKEKACQTAPIKSPQECAELIGKTRATTLNLVPILLEGLILLGEETEEPIHKKLRFVACGGAPLPSAIIKRAKALKIPLYQGFGLSECTTVVSVNSIDHNRPGSVGTVLPHLRIRIAEDGEIIVSGNALMQGYLNKDDQKITEWATGDLGHIDDDGFLFISGRKNSAFSTSAGRNLSPEWIEGELLSSSAVNQALVYDGGLDRPAAIIIPKACWLEKTGQELFKVRKDVKELLQEPLIREILIEELGASMNSLPEYATVKDFTFTWPPFSRKAGEVTPSGILNRQLILKQYTGTQKLA